MSFVRPEVLLGSENKSALSIPNIVPEHLTFKNYVQISLLSLCALIGGPLNVFVFFRQIRRWKRRSSRSLLIRIHLNIADMLILLVYCPIRAIWEITFVWHAGDIMCKLTKFATEVAFQSSSATLACIALDRALSIVTGSFSIIGGGGGGGGNGRGRARIMILFAWLYSIGFSIKNFFFWTVAPIPGDDQGRLQCMSWPARLAIEGRAGNFTHELETMVFITHMVTNFYLPLTVIITCYTIILVHVWRHYTTPEEALLQESIRTDQRKTDCWDPPHPAGFLNKAQMSTGGIAARRNEDEKASGQEMVVLNGAAGKGLTMVENRTGQAAAELTGGHDNELYSCSTPTLIKFLDNHPNGYGGGNGGESQDRGNGNTLCPLTLATGSSTLTTKVHTNTTAPSVHGTTKSISATTTNQGSLGRRPSHGAKGVTAAATAGDLKSKKKAGDRRFGGATFSFRSVFDGKPSSANSKIISKGGPKSVASVKTTQREARRSKPKTTSTVLLTEPKLKVKTFWTTVVLITVYFLCWLPYACVSIWPYIHADSFHAVRKWANIACMFLVVLNSVINPLIYGIYRSEMTKFWRQFRRDLAYKYAVIKYKWCPF